MGVLDLFKSLLPLSENDGYCLSLLEDFEDYKRINKLVRQRKINFVMREFNVSFIDGGEYFQLEGGEENLDEANKFLKDKGLPFNEVRQNILTGDGSKRHFMRIITSYSGPTFVVMENFPTNEYLNRENFAYLMIGKHLFKKGAGNLK